MRQVLWLSLVSFALMGWGGLARAIEGKTPPMPPAPVAVGQDGPEPSEGDMRPGEEKEALEFIREHNPEMHRHLSEAREHRREAFRARMREIAPMVRNPEMREAFKLNMRSERRVRDLAQRFRQAEGKDKEELRKELDRALSEQFDAKLAAHETQLKRMQEEIGRLKERITKRKSLKEKIVKKRLAEMSGDEESWDW